MKVFSNFLLSNSEIIPLQKTDEVLKLNDLKVNDVEENYSNEETEKRAQML